MKILIILTLVYFKNGILCTSDESYLHDSEFTPMHNSIIFSDIVDILKEFDSSMNSDVNFNFYSGETDDNIDDLLLEYQHFVDKARDDQIKVAEKTKDKNIRPIIRHDKIINIKPEIGNENEFSYFSNNLKNIDNSVGLSTSIFSNKNNLRNNFNKKQVLKVTPYNMLSSCFCQGNKLPCECECQQCIMPFNPLTIYKHPSITFPGPKTYEHQLFEDQKFSEEGTFNDLINDKINLNINIDIKMPKILQKMLSIFSKTPILEDRRLNNLLSNDLINSPFPYLSNHIVSFKKPHFYKNIIEPLNKLPVYRKKKSRLNKRGRKHRNKKIITIHDIKMDPIWQKNFTEQNTTSDCEKNPLSKYCVIPKNMNTSINISQDIKDNFNISVLSNVTVIPVEKKDKNSSESIYLLFNISSTIDNKTEDFQKSENSIEQFEKITTDSLQTRRKRDIISKQNETKVLNSHITNSSHDDGKKVKSINKFSMNDDELLYWPQCVHNISNKLYKNITSLILEKEKKKAKVNITQDSIRKNHTIVLEKAIFGDIDWDDVDAVVPVFISFVGKYIRGVLTFCSQSTCHSMYCLDKVCLHRACLPAERFHQIGHCMGRNNTDSVAALESIMDLPSNIALEIVDILEDKMLGKMFGKATLCIAPKCISFIASKKSFRKSKCTTKELNSTGHCSNMKVM